MADSILNEPSPYDTLGVGKDADLVEIRSHHRKLVLKYHPDRVKQESDRASALVEFHKIQKAYDILSDPHVRQRYDDQVKLEQLRKEFGPKDAVTGGHQRTPRPTTTNTYFNENQTWEHWCHYDENGVEVRQRGPKRPLPQHRSAHADPTPRYASNLRYSTSLQHAPDVPNLSPLSGADYQNANGISTVDHSPQAARPRKRGSAEKRVTDIADQCRSKFEGLWGTINGRSVCAAADTGADGNFVSQRLAADAMMETVRIPRKERPLFLMAHGRGLRPKGKARAVWRFEDCPDETHEMDFFVLRDCVFDVMIGAEFLYRNQVLSRQRHLLKVLTRPADALHVRLVRACGHPRQRLSGHVRHAKHPAVFCAALPDSGAEPNLISYAYAERRGWLPYVEPGPPSCRLLQFADGSLEQTMGRITLHWRFRRSRKEKRQVTTHRQPSATRLRDAHLKDQAPAAREPAPTEGYFAFDILHRCPWDMIVGHIFLDDTDAFNSMAHCFSAVESTAPLGINPVIWSRAKSTKAKKKSTCNNATNPPHASVQPQNHYEELEALAKQYMEAQRRNERQRGPPSSATAPVTRLAYTPTQPHDLPLSRVHTDSLSIKSSATGTDGTGDTSAAGSIACSS